MKRREFIKGLALAPVVLAAGRFIPTNTRSIDSLRVSSMQLYRDAERRRAVINSLMEMFTRDIPKEIIEMEFSKGYSLSKQISLSQHHPTPSQLRV